MQLPIGGTFKRGILSGNGHIEVTGDKALAAVVKPDQPFPATARVLGVVAVKGQSPSLSFGTGTVKCTAKFAAGASTGVEVLRPGQQSDFVDAYLPGFEIAEGDMALRFFAQADATVAVAGSAPAIAGFTFGVNSGGGVMFSRVLTMPAETPARTAVLQALSDVRLPQQRNGVDEMPIAGEAVVFEYSGFLDVKAGLAWGYSLTGTESLEAGSLEASLAYDVRMKASVDVGYKLAGEFVMVARAGARPGWIRLTVRKKRDSQFGFAAGFALDARAKLDFAAETVDDVLIAFFGADAKRAIALFDEFQTFTDLSALEKRAGKVLFSSLQKLSHLWIGRALDETSLGRFVKTLGKIVETYKGIDEKIIDLYEDFLKRSRLAQLKAALETIKGLKRREDLVGVSDSEVFDVIRRLGGGDLLTLVENNAAFATVLAQADHALKFLDVSELRQLIDQLQEDLKLDEIFGRLEKISSKEQILALTDAKLQGVIEKILGRTFDEIRKSDLGTALKELQKTLARVNTFRAEMVAKLEKALDRSVSFEINYAYTRASSRTALLDFEFDLRDPRGVALFDLATEGKFDRVFRQASLDVVQVHEAALNQRNTRTGQLQINFVGWKLGRLVELVENLDVGLEVHDGGLVQVFTAEAAIKQRRESGRSAKEISQTAFMLTLSGEIDRTTATPAEQKRLKYLIETLNRMSAGYDSLQIDESTTLDELYEYLLMARWLELIPPSPGDPSPLPLSAAPGQIPSVDAFIKQLADQFPKGFGKITAQYVVRFDDDTLRDAFTAASGDGLEARVSASCRRVVAGHLVTPRRGPRVAAIGVAYAHDGAARTMFNTLGTNPIHEKSFTVKLPGFLKPFGGQRETVSPPMTGSLATLFNVEQSLRRNIRALDELVDEARTTKRRVDVDKLRSAAARVLATAATLDGMTGVNAFFAVVDDLIQQGRQGKGRRESSLILEIEPPEGRKVTKFLMAGGNR